MTVRIIIDDVAVRDVQRRLGEFSDKAPNAIARALNRSITNVKSNITKEVRNDYHIKATDVRSTLKDFKASRSKLAAAVKSQGKPIGLDKFKVSPKTVNPKRRSQLKVAAKKDGVKQVLGAFVADVNGTKIFKREDKKRLPIGRLFGPSVPQMIGSEETSDKIDRQALVTYENRLTHEINHILSRI